MEEKIRGGDEMPHQVKKIGKLNIESREKKGFKGQTKYGVTRRTPPLKN